MDYEDYRDIVHVSDMLVKIEKHKMVSTHCNEENTHAENSLKKKVVSVPKFWLISGKIFPNDVTVVFH